MMNAVSPDYFATLGTRILRGRGFAAADNASARPVVIIDEGLARTDWGGQDPIGQCAYVGSRSDCVEIVGISEPRRWLLCDAMTSGGLLVAAPPDSPGLGKPIGSLEAGPAGGIRVV